MLKGKKICLVISGGIAAYKMPELLRALQKAGAVVRIAVTDAALEFVTETTLSALSRYPVLGGEGVYPEAIGHIALADWSDLVILAPATANTLGKVALGLADNEATSMLLAHAKPLLIVPAMNDHMWAHPATRRNVSMLRQDGHWVLEPDTGYLAEGYRGKGRLVEVAAIMSAVYSIFAIETSGLLNEASVEAVLDHEAALPPKQALALRGQKVVISAGGTSEPLDPVRLLTNRSSGKMGLALASVATLLGADVTFVACGEAQRLPILPQISYLAAHSALDLERIMMDLAPDADMVLMAAAVSDYRLKSPSEQKIKKQTGANLSLELIENPDILAELPSGGRPFLVGFAAETQDVLNYGQAKFKKKGVDLIVANDVSQADIGFASDENAAYLISAKSYQVAKRQSKYALAAKIFKEILRLQTESN